MVEKLTDLDSDVQAIARRWISELEALNSFACFWNCDTACTIRHGLQCLALTTPTQLYIRDFAATFTAMAYQVSGDLSSAYALLEERRRESWTSGPLAQKHILLRMAFVQSLAGELMALRTTTDQMIEIDKELPWTELSAAAYYLTPSSLAMFRMIWLLYCRLHLDCWPVAIKCLLAITCSVPIFWCSPITRWLS